jgi:hypothetical protein
VAYMYQAKKAPLEGQPNKIQVTRLGWPLASTMIRYIQ